LLNTLPIAAEIFTDQVVEVNFDELPSEPALFAFTFNDTDKHLMNIYAEGNETIKAIGLFTLMEQNETQRNLTLEIDFSSIDLTLIGVYEFILVVEDEYGFNSYPWLLEFVDITPPFVFPETAPKFT